MITGSHNPPDYNGLKMMIAGNTLFGDEIQKLRTRLENDDLIVGEGEFSEADVVSDYIQHIVDDVKLGRPLKFAVDCGNGAASEVAVKLFKAFGLQPMELFCNVDGNFPNHHPDPSKEENLVDIRQAIAENNLELGLAFDGDGDRIGICVLPF